MCRYFFFFSFWKRPRETDGGETTYFFLQAKHIEEDYHYSALFLSTCGGKEKERERERKREKDTRRDDERQQRAPHRDDDRCGGRANATFNRIHFWIFLSLIEWSCLRRARKEARTSTRTTSYQQRQQR